MKLELSENDIREIVIRHIRDSRIAGSGLPLLVSFSGPVSASVRPALSNDDTVFEAVCAACNLTKPAMLSKTKKEPIVWARFAAMYLLRQAGRTFPGIALAIGMGDHGTVVNGVRQVKTRMTVDEGYRQFIQSLCHQLGISDTVTASVRQLGDGAVANNGHGRRSTIITNGSSRAVL